ncbi:hypothetical protein B4168_2890 [Anoxybacillus flavithermus]|nr:hypothetical protein B4168_2890 [Anoxybacillus flavithermus]OAO86179.1 hypothetical protein GT23_2072 [Parageobacillus thermoglucosidasius]
MAGEIANRRLLRADAAPHMAMLYVYVLSLHHLLFLWRCA